MLRRDRFLVTTAVLTLVLALELMLLAVTLPARTRDCSDDLFDAWNKFSVDANEHMHKVEAKPDPKRKQAQRERLQREWEAVLACECF